MDYTRLIQAIERLKFHKDRVDHHPEGNVLEHSLQAFWIAHKESSDRELHAAALRHDIGKQICILEHDKLSLDILESFGYYNEKVLWLIKNHIRVIWFIDGTMKKKKKLQELLENKWFKDLVHLRRIDNSARKANKKSKLDKAMINNLLEVTNDTK